MATKALVVLADTAGIVPADTSPNGNTVVLRDGSGGTSSVQVSGSELKTTGIDTTAVKAVQTASTTLDGTAVLWPFNTTAGSLVPTLPLASTVAGRKYTIVKTVGANNLTITPAGGDTINGAATLVLTSAYSAAKLVSDGGTNWYSV
jgi:hypothetical protein